MLELSAMLPSGVEMIALTFWEIIWPFILFTMNSIFVYALNSWSLKMSMCTDCWSVLMCNMARALINLHIGRSLWFLPWLCLCYYNHFSRIFLAWPAILDIELMCWKSHFGLWYNKMCHLLNLMFTILILKWKKYFIQPLKWMLKHL